MLGIRSAVLRESALQRGFLLVEVVLLLLVVELNERLAPGDAVAQVGENAAHLAFRLRRNGYLIDGRERADHFDASLDGCLKDGFGFDRPGGVTPARLSRFIFRAARRSRGDG